MAKTVGELLVDRLIEWRVDTIFGFPGDGINGVFEALRENKYLHSHRRRSGTGSKNDRNSD